MRSRLRGLPRPLRAVIVIVAAVALVAGLLVVVIGTGGDESEPSSDLPPACRSLRAQFAGEPRLDSYAVRSGRLRVDFLGESGGTDDLVAEVRVGRARGRILAGTARSFGSGGPVADLDGDRIDEAATVLSVPNRDGITVSIIFSRGLLTVCGDVVYDTLDHLDLDTGDVAEQIDDLRRVSDCDGDGHPDLVVQTSERDCKGVFGCFENASGVDRHRAYVVSGRRAAKPGRVEVGSDDAPLAATAEEAF